jgi:hypothetical protein
MLPCVQVVSVPPVPRIGAGLDDLVARLVVLNIVLEATAAHWNPGLRS